MLSTLYGSTLVVLFTLFLTSGAQLNFSSPPLVAQEVSIFERRQDCPPCPEPQCFNCNLEDFQCMQFGNCTKSNGKCSCPAGFGDDDCSMPLCGSLPKGKDRPMREKEDEMCNCDSGWEGILCNLCQDDQACNSLMPEKKDGVCYTGGLVQKENHQDCDITNMKIVSMLGSKKARATFSCNSELKTCNFQFWIDALESFYCGLDTCKFEQEIQSNRNITKYECKNINCRCVPGRQLCEDEGVNIGDILASMTGPGHLKTISTEGGDSNDGSTFSEPHLNELVSGIFGDETITLTCKSTECLYKLEVPGFEIPQKVINTPLIAGIIAGCALFVVAIVLLVFFLRRRTNKLSNYGSVYLNEEDEDNTQLTMDHKPTSLHFENVSYDLNGKKILSGVQGAVHPGELMAIMGASGAGKTTFLDILARKNKKGFTRGEFYVNGQKVQDDEFRSVIGFVDQEDTMLPTLTVHETIVDSALLRLPRDMSLGAKLQRVEDVEKQLGISHIRDQLIGSEEGAGRGISGGEKRRVGIACELVTSPRILFLDEPTSGLDAYNAYNVVECLVNLVKTYNRTVVFTIHQPRSNIVALFDQLVLLARGRAVYSGPFSSCQAYFDSIGYACPPGFNIADYLVDLTMHAGETKSPMDEIIEAERRNTATRASSAMAVKSIPSESFLEASESQSDGDRRSMEQESRPQTNRRTSIKAQQDRELFTRRSTDLRGVDTPGSTHSEEEQNLLGNTREAAQSWLRLSKRAGPPPPQVLDDPHQLPPEANITNSDLEILVDSYRKSDVATAVQDDIRNVLTHASNAGDSQTGLNRLNVSVTSGRVTGYRRVGLWTQFKILSVRTWRNIYRNPMLMLAHYAIAVLLACLLGFLFFGITDDIAGFQNRLGLFFFILALWGFSTLTSLTVFASERLLFMRERAKGYYAPISYFFSKVLFDIIPLRLIPPIILGAIVYPMTGLVPAAAQFWRFIMFLVLFNFAAAAICLFIGIIFRNAGLANLIGSLVMLGSLLFAGSLLNKDSIPPAALWLQSLSIFHYGFEGLIVNEVRYLTLIDQKYGLNIEVPGSAILSSFGFNTLALTRDAVSLAIICAVFIVVAYVAMHLLLVERR